MNDAGILAYLEGEKLSLTDEQKAVIRQYDQLLEEWKDQAERLQKEADQAAMAQLVEEEMNRQGVKNQKLIWALLDKDRLSLADGELQGLAEQLEKLRADEETAFLFRERRRQPRFVPVGRTSRHREDGARKFMGLNRK